MQKTLFQAEICHRQHLLIFVPVDDCEKRKMFLPQCHLQPDSILRNILSIIHGDKVINEAQ